MMKLEMKPFWRVEVWGQQNYGDFIADVEYYDTQAEAESRAEKLLQENVDNQEAEEWDKVVVSNVKGEAVAFFHAELENEKDAFLSVIKG